MDTYAIWMLWIRVFFLILAVIAAGVLLGIFTSWITGSPPIGLAVSIAAWGASMAAFGLYIFRKDF